MRRILDPGFRLTRETASEFAPFSRVLHDLFTVTGYPWAMDTPVPPLLRTAFPRRFLALVKLGAICALIALLFIPLALTRGVLQERQAYRTQATEEIAGTWGRGQTLTGPILAIPYMYLAPVARTKLVDGRAVQVDETAEVEATAYFLPETLAIKGAVSPEIRRRGIYDVVVYSASLNVSGSFQPDFAAAGIAADRIDWEKALLYFGVSDLRGIRSIGPVSVGGGAGLALEASDLSRNEVLPLVARLTGASAGTRLDFSLDAALQGSGRLDFLPVGKSTAVDLRSPWADPSFGGAYLPVTRTVTTDGFSAAWQVSHYSRGFGQSWTSRTTDSHDAIKRIGEAGFGVEFSRVVDGYRMVERAQKYAILFFILVFTAFFLFEIGTGLRIHPVQYGLVGVALCLFFLAFLALSEFWSTGFAYGVAAVACTAMISLYSLSFLRTGMRTLVIGGSLGLTYSGLYFVLRSQDYALVAGTAALFAGLGLVMYFTRRLNWSDIGSDGAIEPA